jgi:hypothetical protein
MNKLIPGFIFIVVLYFFPIDVISQSTPENLLVKHYRPKSIYKILKTDIQKAKFPIIDMHSHAYPKDADQIEQWVKNMDEVGIDNLNILYIISGGKHEKTHHFYLTNFLTFHMHSIHRL